MYLYRLQPEAENKSEICRNIEKNMCKKLAFEKKQRIQWKKMYSIAPAVTRAFYNEKRYIKNASYIFLSFGFRNMQFLPSNHKMNKIERLQKYCRRM